MKRIIYILVIIISLFITNEVLAENFYEGEYLGIYVNKVKNNKTYYLNMQLLKERDSDKLVYCLEPFEFFSTSSTYRVYEGNYDGYNISSDKLNRINKLVRYGYGYALKDRMDYKWYAITQVLIWRTVDPSADIYFTDSLNGNRVDNKFINEINELEEDVSVEGNLNVLKSSHEVNYGGSISIAMQDNYYELVDSDCNASMDRYLNIYDVTKDSYVVIREKNTNFIDGYNKIFASDGNQDILIPGKKSSKTKKITIKVLKGSLTLDIRKDSHTKSVDAIFNTCYGVYKNTVLYKKVCASDNQMTKLDNLAYGNYSVRQLSIGEGYLYDNKEYGAVIDNNNKDVLVYLNNKVISNSVNLLKKYCTLDNCELEENAIFEVYNSKGDNLGSYSSDSKGNISIKLDYGRYDIVQVKGMEGYDMVPSINVFIDGSDSSLEYELFDQKIIDDEDEEIEVFKVIDEEPDEIIEEEVEDEIGIVEEDVIIEEIPPNTYVKVPVKSKVIKVINKVISYLKKLNKTAILL